MRKLEDIPKKPVFKVPDGYFDELPTKIQSRIAGESNRHLFTSSPLHLFISSPLHYIRYALPVIALIVFGILWLRPSPALDDQLTDIDTEQIAFYLANNDHTDLEEVPDTDDWTTSELDQLEQELYSDMEYSNEGLLEELDLENL